MQVLSGTTWELMACPARGNAPRACILCGTVVSGKSVHCADILALAEKGSRYDEVLNKTLVNVCQSSVAWHNAEGRSEYMVHNCVGCNHWLQRRARKSNILSPLASMHRFMRTLDMKFIPDARITKRLCQSLNATHTLPDGVVVENYYKTLFTDLELNSIRCIDWGESTDVRHIFARHFAESNAHCLLFKCKKQVEFMREHREPPSLRHSQTMNIFKYDYIKKGTEQGTYESPDHTEDAVFF